MDIKQIIVEIMSKGIVNITLSNKMKNSNELNKVNITLIDDYYQVSEFIEKQVFHKNLQEEELEDYLNDIALDFKQIDGKVVSGDYNIRVNKKGNVLRRFKDSDNSDIVNTHNKSKNYLLSNYEEMQVLKDLKIVSADNQIISSMFDKFRQINKYIELVHDLIKDDNLSKLKIVDFGAGKSYLTFVLYDYLIKSLNIDVEMIGIVLKESVINENIKLASKYGYDNLKFICGDINETQIDDVDMMISLHACDTATDLALNKALEWDVKYIVSVPCCQNELYQQLESQSFPKMVQFNIIKERLSALITDTVRANVLQYSGYSTQVIEYIDSDHSLKNLMIRAKRVRHKDDAALENIIQLQHEYNFKHTLLNLRKLGVDYD